jgi:aminotransferase EvaB
MKVVQEIAQAHDLKVIEDSAQALGAKYGNYNSGASGYTGCFSFYPAKILGCAGDGGALTTNDPDLVREFKLLRDHGFKRDTNELVMYGFNSRLDNIQAAILNVKLKYLPGWINTRREIAQKYQNAFKGIDGLLLPPPPTTSGPYFDVYQNYVIRTERRDELYSYLKDEGIETLISWPKPNHSHPNLGLMHFKLPETEKLSQTVLSLPMFPELKAEELEYVIDRVKAFYGK